MVAVGVGAAACISGLFLVRIRYSANSTPTTSRPISPPMKMGLGPLLACAARPLACALDLAALEVLGFVLPFAPAAAVGCVPSCVVGPIGTLRSLRVLLGVSLILNLHLVNNY